MNGEQEGGGHERRQLAGNSVDGAGGVGVEDGVEKGHVSFRVGSSNDLKEEMERAQGALRVTPRDEGNEEMEAEMERKALVGDLLAEKNHHTVG